MAKSDWGTKRLCQGCGARFYDLMKDPAVCPTCNTELVVQVVRPRRTVAPAKVIEKVAKEVIKDKEKNTDDDTGDDTNDFDSVVLELDEDDDDEEDSGLIEDTSDLSGDNGMEEVKEHRSNDTTDDN